MAAAAVPHRDPSPVVAPATFLLSLDTSGLCGLFLLPTTHGRSRHEPRPGLVGLYFLIAMILAPLP